MHRIARGIKKFVIDNPNPFIIKVNHGSQDFRGQKMDEPLQTITAKNGWGIVTPFIARIGQTGFGGDRLQYDMEKPLTTITSKAEHLLVVPHVTKFRSGSTGHAVDEPLHTITSGSGSVRPAGAAHAMGMVAAFLTKYHGETKGAEVRGQKMDDPLFTLDTSNRFALVTSHLITLRNHGTGQPLTEPTRTITAGGLHLGEVRSFLIKYYGIVMPLSPINLLSFLPAPRTDLCCASSSVPVMMLSQVRQMYNNSHHLVSEPLSNWRRATW